MTQATQFQHPPHPSGVLMRSKVNENAIAQATMHKGAAPPSYAANAGFVWCDDSVSGVWIFRAYKGTGSVSDVANWPALFGIDVAAGDMILNGTGRSFGLSAAVTAYRGSRDAAEIFAGGTGDLMLFHHILTGGVGSIAISTSGTSFNTTSDERLKAGIVDAPSQLPWLRSVRVRQFHYKVDPEHPIVGVIAQEHVEASPDAVTPGDEGEEVARAWGVDPSKDVHRLVKVCQELADQLDAALARLAALEA